MSGKAGSAEGDLGDDKVDKLELEKYRALGRLVKQTTWNDRELLYVLSKFKELVEILAVLPTYDLAYRAAVQDYMVFERMLDLRREMDNLKTPGA